MVAHDAVADAQPEARALANFTRREERIEDAAEVLVIDPVPGVGDEELDRRRPRIETRADGQAARRAAAHRALGVQNEVEQRLLQLAAVGDDRREPGSNSVTSSTLLSRNS